MNGSLVGFPYCAVFNDQSIVRVCRAGWLAGRNGPFARPGQRNKPKRVMNPSEQLFVLLLGLREAIRRASVKARPNLIYLQRQPAEAPLIYCLGIKRL